MSSLQVSVPGHPSATRKYHQHYCNPSDEIILRSEDEVFFRISCFRLSKASTIFAGMFDAAMPTPGKYIEVECDSETLEAFLDLISQTNNFFYYDSGALLRRGFTLIARLHELVHQYDVRGWINILDHALAEAYAQEPDDALRYAAEKEDVEMAKKALAEFGGYRGEGRYKHQFGEIIHDLPDHWQLHLFHLLVTDHGCKDASGKKVDLLVLEPDWSKIADRFDPPDPPPRTPVSME